MKRRFMALMVSLLAFALLSGFTAISASAATTVNGSTVNFTKYMVVDQDTNIPNATIGFTITPGTASAATSTKLAVYAGPAGATVGTVTFTSGDTVYTSLDTGDDVVLSAGEKYAKQTGTINLTGVTFTEPGVYRYELTENAPADPAIVKDTRTLYLDVYVTSDDSANLTVSSTVLHTNSAAPDRNATSGSEDVATPGAAVADKITGFTNRYNTHDLTVSKAVSGNQASRDKYFAVTVTISDVTAGNKYDVDLSSADASIAANPNAATTCITSAVTQPTLITVPAGATTVTQVFYLKNGQSVTIKGLPENASYTVVEAEEDYTPATAVTGDVDASSASEAVITANHQAAGTFDSNDADTVAVAFTNTRAGIIPTGVIMTVAPFAIGLFVFGAAVIFATSRRKRASY
jgi:pilin isopeptide linkage protein